MTTLQLLTSELLSASLSTLSSGTCWFAVQTRPRFEKKVAVDLQEKGIHSFVPLRAVKRQWSDRKQVISLPLFPGYTFVRIPPEQDARVAVLRTYGVTNFVGSRGIVVGHQYANFVKLTDCRKRRRRDVAFQRANDAVVLELLALTGIDAPRVAVEAGIAVVPIAVVTPGAAAPISAAVGLKAVRDQDHELERR